MIYSIFSFQVNYFDRKRTPQKEYTCPVHAGKSPYIMERNKVEDFILREHGKGKHGKILHQMHCSISYAVMKNFCFAYFYFLNLSNNFLVEQTTLGTFDLHDL